MFGFNFFDFAKPVTYGDAFLTIGIVCIVSLGLFLLAKRNASK